MKVKNIVKEEITIIKVKSMFEFNGAIIQDKINDHFKLIKTNLNNLESELGSSIQLV